MSALYLIATALNVLGGVAVACGAFAADDEERRRSIALAVLGALLMAGALMVARASGGASP